MLIDQVMKLAMKYGWGIVTVGIVWKFVSPEQR